MNGEPNSTQAEPGVLKENPKFRDFVDARKKSFGANLERNGRGDGDGGGVYLALSLSLSPFRSLKGES